MLLYYAEDEKIECRYYWKHGIIFMTKEAEKEKAIRVLIKGLYPEKDQHDGVLLIGVEDKGQKARDLQKEIFRKMLELLHERKETRHGPASISAGMDKMMDSERKTDPPTFAQLTKDLDIPVLVSYDGENYVEYDTIKNTTEPKVKAIPNKIKDAEDNTKMNAHQNETKPDAKPANKSDVWLITQNFAAILDQPPAKAKKVFLSYSHQNTAWLTRLRTHIAGLRRDKKIETWDDKEILPGDLWDATIKKQLNEADVYILLLSADFIASEYIWNEELKAALQHYEKRKATVIPVLFEPLDLGGIPGITPIEENNGSERIVKGFKIGDFEIIPKTEKEQQLKPVSLWQNQEEALAKVAERIRKAIEGKKD
ncbi:MAG: toll/interleukin-1 receptor domain-containing protein [Flavisolibacter sp.]|nr:toll/interleukin-1 receptor domain-containing protein [Flavisolibacter sp.]